MQLEKLKNEQIQRQQGLPQGYSLVKTEDLIRLSSLTQVPTAPSHISRIHEREDNKGIVLLIGAGLAVLTIGATVFGLSGLFAPRPPAPVIIELPPSPAPAPAGRLNQCESGCEDKSTNISIF